MSFFIQVQQSLVTHRKTLRLARLLGENRYTVVGRLVALWSWCLDNALESGCLGVDVDAVMLAQVMGWDDDGTPGELVEALFTAGFLDVASGAQGERDRHFHIHDWHEWAPRTTTPQPVEASITDVYVTHLGDGRSDGEEG